MDRWTAAQPEVKVAADCRTPPPPTPPRTKDKGLAQPTDPLAGRLRLWVPRATGALPTGSAPLQQSESPQTAIPATPEPLTTLLLILPIPHNPTPPINQHLYITTLVHQTQHTTSNLREFQNPSTSPSGWRPPAGHPPPDSPATSAPSQGSCPAPHPVPSQPPLPLSGTH